MGQSCSQGCGYGGSYAAFAASGAINDVCAPKPAAVPLRGTISKDEDALLPFHSHAFQIAVARGEEAPKNSRAGWRTAYALGPVLGDGISAKVYEAEALPVPGLEPGARSLGETGILGTCTSMGMPACVREHGRRVAIKRFHRFGSRTFQKELSALRRVGVHPHILRLLESYQGFEGEDVLVLEYCDGATLYDLYAKEHANGGLPERLVARLIRQLLLALEHLSACDVEHQDVKPENMMLYDVSVAAQRGELKLGDFGWAAMAAPSKVGGPSAEVPATGAGSLWYAPPELNPPVEGINQEWGAPVDQRGMPLKGRADMWSVGVVLYLLLVGHNPFNRALKQPSQEAIDAEVMRLSALGQFNNRTERWAQLHLEARDLISVLLRVKPGARPSASEALKHPFLLRRVPKAASEADEYDESVFFHGSVSGWGGRDAAWRRLDGLQRLGWAAVARALAEPELESSVVTGALEGVQAGEQAAAPPWEGTYLWQLARELAATPVFHWLRDRGAWPDVVRLAFCYLDLDADGLLSSSDLAGHVARQGARLDVVFRESAPQARSGALAAASRWITRWRDPRQPPATTATGEVALTIAGLREALLVSHHVDDAIFGEFDTAMPDSRASRGDLAVVAKEEEICWQDVPAGRSGAPCSQPSANDFTVSARKEEELDR